MIPWVGRGVDRLLSRGKGLDASGDPFGPPLERAEVDERLALVRASREAPTLLREPPQGSRAWCVLSPPYGALGRRGEPGLYGIHLAALRREGFGVVLLALPYHGPRALPGRPSGWGFVRADLGETQRAFLDAAAQAAGAARWLREERGAQRVAGMGLSLGALGLGLAAAQGAPFDALAFCAAVDNPASFYGTGESRAARRATLAAHGYDLARVEEAFAPISPSSLPAPKAPSAFAVPPHDAVVPPAWQERWRSKWGGEAIPAAGHGHGTALASPRLAREMSRRLTRGRTSP